MTSKEHLKSKAQALANSKCRTVYIFRYGTDEKLMTKLGMSDDAFGGEVGGWGMDFNPPQDREYEVIKPA